MLIYDNISLYTVIIFFIFIGLFFKFLKNKNKVNLLTVIIIVITTLYIIEIYLLIDSRLTKKDIREKIYKNETGKNFDKRNHFEIYLKEKVNSNLQITVNPISFLNDEINLFPLSGISNSLTLYCNENGYFSYFYADKHGFNNPNEVWNNKKMTDYVLVGDSFTLGACVNPPNDISGNLRRLFNKTVINLGYGGNGPLIAYSTLREYLPHINNKNILYLFWEENELDDLTFELKNSFLLKYYNIKDHTQNLYFRQEEIDKLNLKKIENYISQYHDLKTNEFKTHIWQTLKLYKLRIYTKSALHRKEKIMPNKIPEFKQLLIKFNELAKENNSNFYFVYLPTYNRYDNKFKNTIYEETIDLLNELNIQIIDIKKSFDNHPDPKNLFPFKQHAHYNVEGYKFVAENIFNIIK